MWVIALFYHVQLTTSTPSLALTRYSPLLASPLSHEDLTAIVKRKFLDDRGKEYTDLQLLKPF